MEENKKDDFWNSSDDSFWKEPVIEDDWLKINQATQDNPYASSSWFDNNLSKEPEKQEASLQTFPEKKEDIFNDYTYGEDVKVQYQSATDYQTSTQVYEQITGQAQEKKKKSRAHLIVRLCFAGLAVISVIASAAGYFVTKKAAIRSLKDISFETVAVEDSFLFYENDTVTIDDVAYTVISAESFQGFPKDRKLIAIHVDVKSEIYVRGRYMIREPYVGYEYNDAILYKIASYAEDVAPYLEASRLSRNDILSIYGVGNGIDNTGYYVFVVPENVESVTLYIEQKEEENGVEITKKIFQKELKVLPESEMSKAAFAGKEAE